ncbi:hypothetical protein [Pyrobaculum aerophilum]|uniref:hypothetical protein n=1 Tax=Pyrobaculum aerophilum TaxID=13773 RepID=UPI0011C08407|nr:hypothetical protein [Pyrobaculum aerophilum]
MLAHSAYLTARDGLDFSPATIAFVSNGAINGSLAVFLRFLPTLKSLPSLVSGGDIDEEPPGCVMLHLGVLEDGDSRRKQVSEEIFNIV